MSILNRESPPATPDRPLYVKFDRVMRTAADNGVTLYGTVARFSDGEGFGFDSDQITLYDSHFGAPGKEGELSNPCMIFKEGDYWNVRIAPDKDIALESPLLAEKKPQTDRPGASGGKGGGGYSKMTAENLDAAWAKTRHWFDSVEDRELALACVDKYLGCASLIDYPETQDEGHPHSDPPQHEPVTGDDIPF